MFEGKWRYTLDCSDFGDIKEFIRTQFLIGWALLMNLAVAYGVMVLYTFLTPTEALGALAERGLSLRVGYVLLAGFVYILTRSYRWKLGPQSIQTEDDKNGVPETLRDQQSSMIIRLAMGDAIGYMGIILYVLTDSPFDLLLGALAAAMFFLSYFPSRSRLYSIAQQPHGRTGSNVRNIEESQPG